MMMACDDHVMVMAKKKFSKSLIEQALTEQRFELKEREKAITVAENLAHSLHSYSPK